MMTAKEKKELPIIIGLMLVLVIAVLLFFFAKDKPKDIGPETETAEEKENEEKEEELINPEVIGLSVEQRNIESYSFGTGDTTLLFVGGIHGGYEWNSSLLAYKMIEEFESGKLEVPSNLQIKIIPVLNPDGLKKTTSKEGKFEKSDVGDDSGKNRFNANGIDLNRNFACKWQPTSTWQGRTIKAGTAPFSEPEALALKDFVEKTKPQAVIFWHSQANTVYASECEKGVIPETLTIMKSYAAAAGYKTQASFDAYPITGDAEGWLASLGIPAITVEMKTHTEIEWEANRSGVVSLLDFYKNK